MDTYQFKSPEVMIVVSAQTLERERERTQKKQLEARDVRGCSGFKVRFLRRRVSDEMWRGSRCS